MLQVRDELRMTVIAYQTLYESSIAFGIRKALRAEQGDVTLIERVKRAGSRDLINIF
jgi:dynein light intermediate chain